MTDILKTKSYTAKQIPVLSFSLREVLVHSNPPLKKFAFEFLKSEAVFDNREAFDAAWTKWKQHRNDLATKGELIGESREQSLRSFVREMAPESEVRFGDLYKTGLKIVFPQFVEEALQLLKDRGYRLVCVTNEEPAVLDYLKTFRILDFFELIVLAGNDSAPKPSAGGFEILLDDLDVRPEQVIHIGSQYATDVCGAEAANLSCFLYDPEAEELKNLNIGDELSSQKVISLAKIRQNRSKNEVRVLRRFEEIANIFL